jgi:hypothetical protein
MRRSRYRSRNFVSRVLLVSSLAPVSRSCAVCSCAMSRLDHRRRPQSFRAPLLALPCLRDRAVALCRAWRCASESFACLILRVMCVLETSTGCPTTCWLQVGPIRAGICVNCSRAFLFRPVEFAVAAMPALIRRVRLGAATCSSRRVAVGSDGFVSRYVDSAFCRSL